MNNHLPLTTSNSPEKCSYHVRLFSADDAKEGRESEYQYKIHFDDVDGYVIKSEGVPEKEIVFPENK